MADWYAENTLRAWPLLDEPYLFTYTPPVGSPYPVALPTTTLVDFGSVLGPGVLLSPTQYVWLAEISRTGTTLTFTLQASFEGLETKELTFVRDVTDPVGTTQYSEVMSFGGCGSPLVWQGWLVTGPLTDLAAIVTDGGTLTANGPVAQFAPTCNQSMYGGYVNSINVANQSRTLATTPGLPAPAPNYELVVQSTCLTGNVSFAAGANAALRVDAFDNSITVDAGLGAGTGQVCGEIPTWPGETLPSDSPLYSGGPTCGQLLKTINGQTGPVLTITAGTGITIMPDPNDTYGIIISGSMNTMTVCPGQGG